jgi:predicted flavoprotein YhiN
MREPASSPDFAYPALAAFRLGGADAKARAAEAMRTLESTGGTDPSVRNLSQAILLRASGMEGPALAQFSKTLRESKETFVQYLAASELARKRMP